MKWWRPSRPPRREGRATVGEGSQGAPGDTPHRPEGPAAVDGGGTIDVHSHLVPGVDDGSRSVEEALAAVGRLVDEGVDRIVTTPHLRGSVTRAEDRFERVMAAMDEGWFRISEAVQERFPELIFQRGHEVLLDVPDPDLSDPRVRLAGSSAVLVEWPNFRVPPETPRSLRRLVEAGVRPVVAHPERYQGYRDAMARPGEWREVGALLQVNLGSLLGIYGPQARDRALMLLARGWVDVLATDFHGREDVMPYVAEARALLEGAGDPDSWALLTRVNPQRVLEDQDPLPVAPVEIRDSLVQRLRRLFGARA